jgi:hypothetical protein
MPQRLGVIAGLLPEHKSPQAASHSDAAPRKRQAKAYGLLLAHMVRCSKATHCRKYCRDKTPLNLAGTLP